MLRFILTHPRVLAFGLLMTLFSSFGQTFLIAIFVPRLLESFGLGAGAFGALYASATILSALCLPFFGRLIDRVPLRRFSMAAGLGLAASCFGMALAGNVATLFLSILGLRLTGQGLLSLTASTTMARVFDDGRGKALSVSSMGYPLGEGLLPLAVVLMIHGLGWRLSWMLLGILMLVIFLPATQSLLRRDPSGTRVTLRPDRSSPRANAFLKDPVFYLLLPANLVLPLVLTALFLYQIQLGESLGWDVETMASAFIGFAVARMAFSLVVGPLIDRWTSLNILPLLLIPALLGIGALLVHNAPWIAFLYLILVGASQGMAGPMMTSVWAEVYGVESLGATKGMVATFGVMATALGPMLMGAGIAADIAFEHLVMLCLALLVTATVIALFGRQLARRRATSCRPCRVPDRREELLPRASR